MDSDEIRNSGPRVVLKDFVCESINSCFCGPADFAWLGDGRKPQGALSDPAVREKNPECLAARFPAQWAA